MKLTTKKITMVLIGIILTIFLFIISTYFVIVHRVQQSDTIWNLINSTIDEINCIQLQVLDYKECLWSLDTQYYIDKIIEDEDIQKRLADIIGTKIFNDFKPRIYLMKDIYESISYNIISDMLLKKRWLTTPKQKKAALLAYIFKLDVNYMNPFNIVNLKDINEYTKDSNEFVKYSRALRQTRLIVWVNFMWWSYEELLKSNPLKLSANRILLWELPKNDRIGKSFSIMRTWSQEGLISYEHAIKIIEQMLECDINNCSQKKLLQLFEKY